MKLVNEFFATARERYRIKQNRQLGCEFPWTEDEVFQKWRFCNVHREDDRTTVWFRENIRNNLSGLRVIEATMAFRWFNRIETVEVVKDLFLGDWDGDEAIRRLEHVQPVTNGAYIITSQHGYPKAEGVVRCIDVARRLLPVISAPWGGSLQEAHASLLEIPYIGRFMSYEIITDLRWTDVLRDAKDIDSWASAGPGCARGLSRVVHGGLGHFNYGSKYDQEEMLEIMLELLLISRETGAWPKEWKQWEMREVEHWACEFDKYERARGGARLKRRYP